MKFYGLSFAVAPSQTPHISDWLLWIGFLWALFCSSTLIRIAIHPKSGSSWSLNSANFLNFPPKFRLRTRKFWLSTQIFRQNWQFLTILIVFDNFVAIYALLSWIFCRDLHIFSANFCWAKSQTPPICLLFGCMLIAGKLLSWLLSNGRKMPCPVTVRSGITSKNYEDVIGELLLLV